MFIKKNYYILNEEKLTYIYNFENQEIFKTKNNNFMESLFNFDFDEKYLDLEFLSKKPQIDAKYIKEIKEIEKIFINHMFEEKLVIPNIIYEILSFKRLLYKNHNLILFPKILYNLNKMIPNNTKNIVTLEDVDLFGIYQTLLKKNVSTINKDIIMNNFHKFITKEYNIKMNVIDNKFTSYNNNEKFDLGYVNPTYTNSSKSFKSLKTISKNILTIMPDQNNIYKYLGKPKNYFPMGSIALNITKNINNRIELIPHSYMNDIYLV